MLMDNSSLNNTAPNEYTPAKPNKQGGKILATAVIALIIGGAIASAIFIAINNLNKGSEVSNCDENKQEKISIEPAKDESGKEIAGKGIILDARLTAELAYKTNRVIANVPSSEKSPRVDTTGNFSDYASLSDDMRASIVLSGKLLDNEVVEEIDTAKLPDSFSEKQSLIENGFKKSRIVRISSAIKDEYRYLFGKEFTHFADNVTSDFNTQSCPASYVSDAAYYVLAAQCGGMSTVRHYIYQYKYELDNDKAYVYFGMMAEDWSDNIPSFYSGFRNDDKLVSGLTKEQGESLQGQGVGYEIYDRTTGTYINMLGKVQHYRAVFEKGSDGDFYYKTLEKVND